MFAYLRDMSMLRKLVALGLLALFLELAPTVWVIQSRQQALQTSANQAEGAEKVRAVLGVVQLVQQHRGLSNGVLSGNDGLDAQRKGVAAKTRTQWAKVEALVAESPDAIKQTAADAAGNWRTLVDAVDNRAIPAPRSFGDHTGLILILLDLTDRLLDAHEMARAAQADTAHRVAAFLLHQPRMLEAMAQLRGRGTGYLSAKHLSASDRVSVAVLASRVRLHQADFERALRKAMDADPNLRTRLEKDLLSGAAGVDHVLKLVDDEIVRPDTLSHDPKAFFAATTSVIDAHYALAGAELEAMAAVLQSRSDAAQRSQILLVALVIIGLSVVGVLGVAGALHITRSLTEATRAAQALARGDLTVSVRPAGGDELGQLQAALAAMVVSLRSLVGQVRGGIDTVTQASHQIESDGQTLSARTEQQASGLQHTAASIEQMTTAVHNNAESARRANELARQVEQMALRGGESVSSVVQSMDAITARSRRIGDIVGVIDGIAFQTNILALNAAVEAARAGEQGRGFAVVAAEVRTLAQRSAAAAKEIKELIAGSEQVVHQGGERATTAATAIEELVAEISEVTQLLGHITEATAEQATGIADVNAALSGLDRTTHQNAGMVEKTATAVARLRAQADRLAEAVQVFKLSGRSAE